jgi:Tfp pilus assembly protein PilV
MTYLSHVHKTPHGFSLIEVLIYISVTVLVSLAGVLTYLSLSITMVRNETERAVSHAAQVTLERMVRDIREATSINSVQSTFGASPGVLALVAGATTTEFSLSGGNVILTVNGTDVGPLTSNEVTADQLLFTHYVGTSTELVRVSLTLSASNKAASTTRTYFGSAVLRGSYE